MLKYTIHRVFGMVPTLIAISVIIFTIIQLPPGDYLETFIAELQAQGEKVDPARIEFLREQYLLDQPVYVQYWAWISGFVRGDLGFSFEHKLPVSEVIGHRVWLSIIVALTTIVFTYAVSFPIGIYSAVRQYSLGDYTFTFIGFLGLATPNFLLALILPHGPLLHRPALELGQDGFDPRPPLGAGHRDRYLGNRLHDPAPARQPPG
jgi:peptide/nickel transport system permease protein